MEIGKITSLPYTGPTSNKGMPKMDFHPISKNTLSACSMSNSNSPGHQGGFATSPSKSRCSDGGWLPKAKYLPTHLLQSSRESPQGHGTGKFSEHDQAFLAATGTIPPYDAITKLEASPPPLNHNNKSTFQQTQIFIPNYISLPAN
jgi:hypothetical protein